MPEQEVNSAAAKFISSLVKSLQILCNGQVDFAESIELVGHINVRVDHKYKFDYIVDEQVSKEGEDSSTTFLSNSYHSCPPVKQYSKKFSPNMDQDVMFAELPQNALSTSRQTSDLIESRSQSQEFAEEASLGDVDSNPNYSVTVESSSGGVSQANQMVVKLEGGDDSNDCMVLPASPESHGSQSHGRVRKRRQPIDQGPDDSNDSKVPFHQQRRESGKHLGVSTVSSQSSTHMATLPLNFSNQMSSFDGIDESNYRCLTCLIPFRDLDSFTSHTAMCQDHGSVFRCKVCPAIFSSYEDYRDHMKGSHKYMSCSHCPTWCPSWSALRGHIHREHKPKFVCSICSKTFHCKINYKGHMNMHTGAKPYACSKCGKSFAYQQSKLAHEKICFLSLS